MKRKSNLDGVKLTGGNDQTRYAVVRYDAKSNLVTDVIEYVVGINRAMMVKFDVFRRYGFQLKVIKLSRTTIGEAERWNVQ